MRHLILVLAVVIGGPATADTDFQCVNQCTGQGNVYGLCLNKCSFASQPVQPISQQTDFQCVNRCTAQGMLYGLCVSRCSY